MNNTRQVPAYSDNLSPASSPCQPPSPPPPLLVADQVSTLAVCCFGAEVGLLLSAVV